MTRYSITHQDRYGERHQLEGAYEANTPEEAIRLMLDQARADDDGHWEAWPVTSDGDIIT